MPDRYDVVIIGAGQAALPLAHALAKAGRSVAIVERKHVGGSCINFGCTPTKAAIASARVAHTARRAAEYGIAVGGVTVDFARVLQRARGIAVAARGSLEDSLRESGNPCLLRGQAKFMAKDGSAFRLSVGARTLLAGEVVIDTGTRTALPAVEGLDGVDVIDSGNWLDRPQLPARLLIAGGGYIGLEMGQFYRRMGSEVVIVQPGEQVAGHEDREVAGAMQALLEAEGVRFRLGVELRRVRREGDGLVATVESPTGSEEMAASHLFIATGRRPNTDDLGLETVGVRIDERGFVSTDTRLRGSVAGVWAAGDIRGGPMFTHTAWDDYRILESQMIGDGSRTLDRVVPYAIFTDPELGRVGLTEREARRDGRSIRIGRFKLRHNGKAKELGETTGFVKVIVDAHGGKCLGAAVLAPHGAELVHVFVDLMNADAPVDAIERAVHIHPTLAEALQSAVTGLRG